MAPKTIEKGIYTFMTNIFYYKRSMGSGGIIIITIINYSSLNLSNKADVIQAPQMIGKQFLTNQLHFIEFSFQKNHSNNCILKIP